jgi:hypothetical protein
VGYSPLHSNKIKNKILKGRVGKYDSGVIGEQEMMSRIELGRIGVWVGLVQLAICSE